eukprot:TRINITY_DN2936_c0_g1_i1.p1 TRINITY_DN2936_c0_g1~~TRINITY_DN2936_c0_g1_i1.p1  ORF type:complete len:1040 (+),score=184.74 TRINITY_DN2936_c0_g1_i1:1511-4630(+)
MGKMNSLLIDLSCDQYFESIPTKNWEREFSQECIDKSIMEGKPLLFSGCSFGNKKKSNEKAKQLFAPDWISSNHSQFKQLNDRKSLPSFNLPSPFSSSSSSSNPTSTSTCTFNEKSSIADLIKRLQPKGKTEPLERKMMRQTLWNCPESWRTQLEAKMEKHFILSERDLFSSFPQKEKQKVFDNNLWIQLCESKLFYSTLQMTDASRFNLIPYSERNFCTIWIVVLPSNVEMMMNHIRSHKLDMDTFSDMEDSSIKQFPVKLTRFIQRENDLVFMPPNCIYERFQVMDGISVNIWWETIPISSFSIAVKSSPLLSSYGVREDSMKKVVAFHTLNKLTKDLERKTSKDELLLIAKLLGIMEQIIVSEWINIDAKMAILIPPLPEIKTIESCLGGKYCSFCRQNIFNRCFACDECTIQSKRYFICFGCVSKGRGCIHIRNKDADESKHVELVQWNSFKYILKSFQQANQMYEKYLVDCSINEDPKWVLKDFRIDEDWSLELLTKNHSVATKSMAIYGQISIAKKPSICHHCRTKEVSFGLNLMAQCMKCMESYCEKCLWNNCGYSFDSILDDNDWSCPKCKGNCNCLSCGQGCGPVFSDQQTNVFFFNRIKRPNICAASDKPMESRDRINIKKEEPTEEAERSTTLDALESFAIEGEHEIIESSFGSFIFDNLQSTVETPQIHTPIRPVGYDGTNEESRRGGQIALREMASQQRSYHKERRKKNPSRGSEAKWGVSQKVQDRTLLVGNINWMIEERDVKKLFDRFGRIGSIQLPTREDPMLIVKFDAVRDALKAKERLNNYVFQGRELKIETESDRISRNLWAIEEENQREIKLKLEAPPSPPRIVKSFHNWKEEDEDSEENDFEIPYIPEQNIELNLNEDESDKSVKLEGMTPITVSTNSIQILEKSRDPRLGGGLSTPIPETMAPINPNFIINQLLTLATHQSLHNPGHNPPNQMGDYEYKDFINKKCDPEFRKRKIHLEHHRQLKKKAVHQFLEKDEGRNGRTDPGAVQVMQECAKNVLNTYDFKLKNAKDLEQWLNQ